MANQQYQLDDELTKILNQVTTQLGVETPFPAQLKSMGTPPSRTSLRTGIESIASDTLPPLQFPSSTGPALEPMEPETSFFDLLRQPGIAPPASVSSRGPALEEDPKTGLTPLNQPKGLAPLIMAEKPFTFGPEELDPSLNALVAEVRSDARNLHTEDEKQNGFTILDPVGPAPLKPAVLAWWLGGVVVAFYAFYFFYTQKPEASATPVVQENHAKSDPQEKISGARKENPPPLWNQLQKNLDAGVAGNAFELPANGGPKSLVSSDGDGAFKPPEGVPMPPDGRLEAVKQLLANTKQKPIADVLWQFDGYGWTLQEQRCVLLTMAPRAATENELAFLGSALLASYRDDLPALFALLDVQSARYRENLVNALGRAMNAQFAVDPLLEHFFAEHWDDRMYQKWLALLLGRGKLEVWKIRNRMNLSDQAQVEQVLILVADSGLSHVDDFFREFYANPALTGAVLNAINRAAPGAYEVPSFVLDLIGSGDENFQKLAMLAAGRHRAHQAVPALIQILESQEAAQAVKETALWALQHITGKSFKGDAAQWRLWWNDFGKP
jgi:hypothetical protein